MSTDTISFYIIYISKPISKKKKHFETLIVSEKICEKFIDLMSSKLLMRIMRKFVDANFCTITFTITLI